MTDANVVSFHVCDHLWCSGQMEEVPGELTQDDLAPDDVMVLDTWDQVSVLSFRALLYLDVFLT